MVIGFRLYFPQTACFDFNYVAASVAYSEHLGDIFYNFYRFNCTANARTKIRTEREYRNTLNEKKKGHTRETVKEHKNFKSLSERINLAKQPL